MSRSKPEQELQKIRRLPFNLECADCTDVSTGFAAGWGAVVMPFKTFVCHKCKSAHQSFSHLVKSVQMSNWSQEEVNVLKQARGGGNAVCRLTWQGGLAEAGMSVPSKVRRKLCSYCTLGSFLAVLPLNVSAGCIFGRDQKLRAVCICREALLAPA